MKIRAGQLRNQITIETKVTSRDAFGGIVETWATHVTLYARIEYSTGSESTSGDQVSAGQKATFTCRVDPAVTRVTPQMRVIHDSRVFDIESAVNFDDRGHHLTLVCMEREL